MKTFIVKYAHEQYATSGELFDTIDEAADRNHLGLERRPWVWKLYIDEATGRIDHAEHVVGGYAHNRP